MATQIQTRRGTTTQHSSFTGAAGEITVDTDKNTVVVHDGSTAGGHAIEAGVNSVNTQTGSVVLDADDIDDTSTTHKFATAAQLTDLGTAVQPGDLATVATSGSYNDLSNQPTIPAAIDDLSDVDTSTVAPTDGQTLVWDNANSQWEPGTVSDVTEIRDLSDVDWATAQGYEMQQGSFTNSGEFQKNGSLGFLIDKRSKNSLGDLPAPTANGSFYFSTSEYGPFTELTIDGSVGFAGGTAYNLEFVSTTALDAVLTGSTTLYFHSSDPAAAPTDGQVLTWDNANSQWVPEAVSAVPTAGGTFTGDVEFDGDIAADGVYTGAVTAVAALAIDCSSSNYFTKTINANSTFTFTNVPATRAFSFTLELTHTSGTVTWPASVKFPGDTAPSLTTGKTHLFMFITDDGGTTFRGASLVDYTN